MDRAINGRMTVREGTLRKISDAAHRIGYHGRALQDDRLAQSAPRLRLGFVLLKQNQEFYRNFAEEITRSVAARTDLRSEAVIRFSSSQSPAEFTDLLQEVGGDCDATVAAVAGKAPTPTTGRDGMMVLALAEAALFSVAEGRRVRVRKVLS